MEENKQRGYIGIIVVLVLLVLGLVGYIVYDKVLSDNQKPVEETTNNETNDSLVYDEKFFDEYLYVFFPMNSASNFLKNIDSFSNDDITTYLFWYYNNLGIQKKIKTDEEKNGEEYNGNMSYTISKSDFDEVVYNMFGVKNYEVVQNDPTWSTGVFKIDDNTYQVRTKASGWHAPLSKIKNIDIANDNAVVEYNLLGTAYDNTEGQVVGNLKFYLTKNNQNWNITKIEYNKTSN